jgi:DNA-nicking Smr family endonuclease
MIRDRHPRRLRRLSADEHTLWKTVTRAVKPLKAALKQDAASDEAPSAPAEKRTRNAPPVASVSKEKSHSGPPPLAPIERRLRQRLAKGRAAIDDRLDLHGKTQRQAHDELLRFLHRAQADGAKVVLVVTGKGTREAEHDPFAARGVLRRLVPQWLNAPDLRRLVVGYETAHAAHGGEGALYVRLRRLRGPAATE